MIVCFINSSGGTWDPEWGQVINRADFLLPEDSSLDPGSVFNDSALPNSLGSVLGDDKTAAETEPHVPTTTKLVSQQIDVKCRVRYVALEGRSDMISVQNIIKNVAPRRLVLVHGPAAAKLALQQYSDAKSENTKVFCPGVGETCDLSSSTNSFAVQLSDQLINSLSFTKVNDYEIAHVNAFLSSDAKTGEATLCPVATSLQTGRHGVFLDQPTMANVSDTLRKHGLVPFSRESGRLVYANGMVSIRVAKTQIQIEGDVCPEYFRIRKILYGLFEIV